jgi:hypothetical protein
MIIEFDLIDKDKRTEKQKKQATDFELFSNKFKWTPSEFRQQFIEGRVSCFLQISFVARRVTIPAATVQMMARDLLCISTATNQKWCAIER